MAFSHRWPNKTLTQFFRAVPTVGGHSKNFFYRGDSQSIPRKNLPD